MTEMTTLDKRLAAAKARAEARAAGNPIPKATAVKASATESKSTKVRKSDADKAAEKAAIEAKRAAKKAERDAAREAKRAEKAAATGTKAPAHMAKVMKAGAKLPALSDTATQFFENLKANLNSFDLSTLALHLQHYNRVEATLRAATQKVENGSIVRIIGGDPRYVGMIGEVVEARKIRCFVDVEEVNKPIYLFTSDVEVLDKVTLPVASTEDEAEVMNEMASETDEVVEDATGTEG